jgi:SNF2 family DNA or RNA helicase
LRCLGLSHLAPPVTRIRERPRLAEVDVSASRTSAAALANAAALHKALDTLEAENMSTLDKAWDEACVAVFVQFIKAAQIIGRMLQGESIKFLYYFGDGKMENRSRALKAFHDDESIQILVREAWIPRGQRR